MNTVPPAAGPTRLRWHDWPWAAKLLLLLGTLSLAPLLALTLYNAAAARSEVLAATRTQNLQQARNTAQILDHLLDKIVADLSTVAVAPGSVRFLSGTPRIEPQVVMERWLRQTREIQGFDALYIVDSDGTVLLATDPRLNGRNVVATRSFQDAMAENTGFDGPRYDPEDGRIHLYVSGPVHNPEGRILGVVVGRVRMSEIDTVIRADTGFAGRGEFGILWDADGVRLSHPARPYLRFRPFESLAPDVASRRIVEQRFGPDTARLLTVERPVSGIVNHSQWLLYEPATSPYIRLEVPGASALQGAVVPLRSNRWLYGLFSPESAALASIRKQTQRNVLAAALTALLAAVLASVAAGWAVRPLRRVGQAADAIARGDLTRRVGLRQRDEVGQLAAAFDAMADSLAAKDLELRRYAGRLEQRVAEQTAELRGLVSREQEARRKAEEANRIKDEFLSTVSHELRTPLNAILSWVWLLAGGKLGPEETRRALASIERNARAQGQIVEDLLDVSRIITGKLRLDVRPFDLTSVIMAAI
ncbi:MAG TPA: cache domain-containing protein, partial [Thermoanaerobaculia bacterium]|nr:cache domain-containing protein [Thermoanaerobaculia bacterium]